ncbi:MAG: trigger factor [Bryobacterales bacterium]|nr:trigger factor [Bryobacterales bacterium]
MEITVPADEVEVVRQKVVGDLAAKVSLPGFRPGKAPKGVILSRFRDDIRRETIDQLLGRAFAQRAQELDLDVASTPSVKDLKYDEGEPLTFTAEFEVRPAFELLDYSQLEVPYAEPQVADDEVDARLQSMREQRAELVNVDPRPVEDGDVAVISIESKSDVGTEEPIRQDEMNLEVGGEYTLPEFNENVRGMQVGESREFDVVYPEDYSGKNLAGRTVTFEVKLNGLRRRELPELNDEFAQDLGDYKGMDDLREAIRGSLIAQREFHARDQAKQAIVEKLGQMYTFPVPESFVEQQVQTQMRRLIRQLAEQGADMENLGVDWKQVMAEQHEPAVRAVRAGLVLDRIGDAESIQVSQREVDDEIARAAKRERVAVTALQERLDKDGGIERLATQLRTEKTLNILFEKAVKVAPSADQPEGSETNAGDPAIES